MFSSTDSEIVSEIVSETILDLEAHEFNKKVNKQITKSDNIGFIVSIIPFVLQVKHRINS